MQSQTHMYHTIKLSESQVIAILLNSLDQAEKKSLSGLLTNFFVPAIIKKNMHR